MKLITAFIQPERLNVVKQELFKAGMHKMSVTNALGCGQQKGYTEHYRGVDIEVNLLKKVRVEIAVNETFVATARYSLWICSSASASARGRRGRMLLGDYGDDYGISTRSACGISWIVLHSVRSCCFVTLPSCQSVHRAMSSSGVYGVSGAPLG